jgi:hypothetical protein
MGFLGGFIVGRALASDQRPYRKATPLQACLLYPGAILIGLSLPTGMMNGDNTAGAWMLFGLGAVLVIAGIIAGTNQRS